MTIRYQRSAAGYRVERVPAVAPAAPEPARPGRDAAEVALQAEVEAARVQAVQLADDAAALRRRLNKFARETRHRVELRKQLFPQTRAYRPPPAAPPPTLSADLLKRARAEAGLSQRDLADKLHLHRGQVADGEGGRRGAQATHVRWALVVLAAAGINPLEEAGR